MIYQDDRTPEEKVSHPLIVVMTDAFLSGWGMAERGASFAGWACRPKDVRTVEEWVRSRSEARRVRVVRSPYRPKGCVHCHVYVVGDGHPALGGD